MQTAYRSPWQNCYVERVIGTLRRECLNHVVPLNELCTRSCGRSSPTTTSRTHQFLDGDASLPRSVVCQGEIVSSPVLGGLHHRYSTSRVGEFALDSVSEMGEQSIRGARAAC
jgi:hypothetical protein